MGFSSMDDFISETTSGKSWRADFMKIFTGGTVVAGRWYDLTPFGGVPTAYLHGNYISNYDFLAGTVGWTLSAGLAYTPATHLITKSGGNAETLTQNTSCVSGTTYSVIYTIAAYAGSGNVTVSLGGTAGTNRTANGTYTENISCGAGANAPLTITVAGTVSALTIDLIIVRQALAFSPYKDTGFGAATGAATGVGGDLAIYHGGSVGPDTKHVVNYGAWGNATTTAPSVLMLVDMLGAYTRIRTDLNTSQSLTNTITAFSTFTVANATDIITHTNNNLMHLTKIRVSNSGGALPTGLSAGTDYWVIKLTDLTCKVASSYANAVAGTAVTLDDDGTGTQTMLTLLPRYTDGKGVRAFYAIDATNGANAQNFVMSYTNQADASGRSLAATVSNTASAIQSHISHSGVAAGNYGPFLPLGGGDAGIRSIESCQFSAASASAGFVNLVLCKPIASLPITTGFVAAERDLMNQLPSLPRVYDGACLGFLVFAGAVLASGNQYQGYFDACAG
jgi:hypothetical protein